MSSSCNSCCELKSTEKDSVNNEHSCKNRVLHRTPNGTKTFCCIEPVHSYGKSSSAESCSVEPVRTKTKRSQSAESVVKSVNDEEPNNNDTHRRVRWQKPPQKLLADGTNVTYWCDAVRRNVAASNGLRFFYFSL